MWHKFYSVPLGTQMKNNSRKGQFIEEDGNPYYRPSYTMISSY